ncbi:hypothetical protein EL22_01080 [Halostagnicola sp. A56]|nr:hypothetical protein EL22_01080 [Halostagnicola sp. A56]
MRQEIHRPFEGSPSADDSRVADTASPSQNPPTIDTASPTENSRVADRIPTAPRDPRARCR